MIVRSYLTEDSTHVLRARVTDLPTAPDEEGEPLVQADFESIEYTVHLDDDVVAGHNDANLDPEDVIFDELQGWDKDSVGFNFKFVLSP